MSQEHVLLCRYGSDEGLVWITVPDTFTIVISLVHVCGTGVTNLTSASTPALVFVESLVKLTNMYWLDAVYGVEEVTVPESRQYSDAAVGPL